MIDYQKITKAFFFFFLFVSVFATAQTLTQTVKGRVLDAETEAPLFGANIVVLNVGAPKGAITDEQGFFRLEGVSVGRSSFQFTFLGYEKFVVSEIIFKTCSK